MASFTKLKWERTKRCETSSMYPLREIIDSEKILVVQLTQNFVSGA